MPATMTAPRPAEVDPAVGIAPDRPTVSRSSTRPRPHAARNGHTPRDRADSRLFARYAATGDPLDREAIIERFLPLARQLAAGYHRPLEPFDDIFQAACYGLVKAVDRFEPERGGAFTSYAVPTIVGEIKRHFRDRTWAVRVPRDLQDLSLRVDRSLTELTRTLGRQPSVEEVAEVVGVEPDDVLEAMQAGHAYRANSLDAPRPGAVDEEEGATLGETLGGADEGFARAEARVLIADLVQSLSPRERRVLEMRFHEDLTQAEIGARIGVGQMQVSRILRGALAQLHALAISAETAPPAATNGARRRSR